MVLIMCLLCILCCVPGQSIASTAIRNNHTDMVSRLFVSVMIWGEWSLWKHTGLLPVQMRHGEGLQSHTCLVSYSAGISSLLWRGSLEWPVWFDFLCLMWAIHLPNYCHNSIQGCCVICKATHFHFFNCPCFPNVTLDHPVPPL